MSIPVANIYYLLAYAWDKLAEQHILLRDAEDCKTPVDLLAKILANGTAHLFKKGLDRNYREEEDLLTGVKGKLLLAESLKKRTFHRGQAVCEFDEFNHNVLHNQILKSTLGRLQKVKFLDDKIHREVRLLYARFNGVSEINFSKPDFRRIQLHRNNQFYGFLLNVCELLYDGFLPNEKKQGQRRIREFWEEESRMPALFEAFVRNFYKRELRGVFRVKRDDVFWQFSSNSSTAHDFLPKMQTDMTLRSAERKIIIETKFYKDIFAHHLGGRDKFRNEHLNQIFSYIKNQHPDEPLSNCAEGILLYACAGISIPPADYNFEGHRIAVQAVDLSEDWQLVRAHLLRIIE